MKVPSSSGTGYEYELTLRPAVLVKATYGGAGGVPLAHAVTAHAARRADPLGGAWFVVLRDGTHVGVLEEWSGAEPWCVRRLDRPVGVVGKAGIGARRELRCAATWQEALARSWWV